MLHQLTLRIPFGDVDHAGFVYYPRVFHYFHLAYESFFHDALGLPFQEMFDTGGVTAPIVHAEAGFHAPLRHGDTVVVRAWISRLGERSWTWCFQILLDGDARETVRAHGRVTKTFVDRETLRAVPLDPTLRARVAPWVEGERDPEPRRDPE